MDYRAFQRLAGEVMGNYFSTTFIEKEMRGVPKRFDFVSADDTIVGDAKYLTLVRGQKIPPAKFSDVSEHVWLLEKVSASIKFLAFGNDRMVPELWLKRYGNLAHGILFFFVDDEGGVEKLQ